MIKKGEDLLSRRLGRPIRKSIWNRGRGGLSHHFSEILLKDNQLPRSLE
jgi:hypothetical protein